MLAAALAIGAAAIVVVAFLVRPWATSSAPSSRASSAPSPSAPPSMSEDSAPAPSAFPTLAASVDARSEDVADAPLPAPALVVQDTTHASDASASDASASPELPSDASASTDLPSVDATKGILLMPAAADTHRVYVDGRLAGVPPPPIVVGCGPHVVKIGSRGREQSVLVPCGGSVSLAYP
jgi:hypothetical protein